MFLKCFLSKNVIIVFESKLNRVYGSPKSIGKLIYRWNGAQVLSASISTSCTCVKAAWDASTKSVIGTVRLIPRDKKAHKRLYKIKAELLTTDGTIVESLDVEVDIEAS
jgi:hypothetical protein